MEMLIQKIDVSGINSELAESFNCKSMLFILSTDVLFDMKF